MAGDHLDKFKAGLEAAKALKAPTRESRAADFEETFYAVLDAIRSMNDLLETHQPTSTVSWTAPSFDSENDILQVQIRGSKLSGKGSVLGFRFQGNRIYSSSPAFIADVNARPASWEQKEQVDLVERITAHFTKFFSEP